MESSPSAIPFDDLSRQLRLSRAEGDSSATHLSVVGDTYTILVSGADTAGCYCLVDMHIPPGGGPPPHRHDFEEMFTLLSGEIEFTFRDQPPLTARAGDTLNIPANAPHSFRNASQEPARLLCLCAPAGQDEFFSRIGDPVPTRTSPPPQLTEAEKAERMKRALALAPEYRTELLPPPED